jgi:hypothetical protein
MLFLKNMTADRRAQALLRQISELPSDTRKELLETLIEMYAEELGIYPPDDDDRALSHPTRVVEV